MGAFALTPSSFHHLMVRFNETSRVSHDTEGSRVMVATCSSPCMRGASNETTGSSSSGILGFFSHSRMSGVSLMCGSLIRVEEHSGLVPRNPMPSTG